MIAFIAARSALGALGGLYCAFTGPQDPSLYPDPTTSPYHLPYESGTTRWCAQSNHGIVSHFGPTKSFAWDFAMPVGTSICAARPGTVVQVVQNHGNRGIDKPNNLVTIDHGDGTQANYLHIRKNGAKVVVGQTVTLGQVIAESGNVGRSLTPHLHFQVRRGKTTIPVSFHDVTRHRGVPRLGFTYRAG